MYLSAVWRWNNATFDDNTSEAGSPGGTSFNCLGATNHIEYFGNDIPIDGLQFSLDVLGSYGAMTWKYWNGTVWKQAIPIISYNFAADGYVLFSFRNITDHTPVAFSATFPQTATPPDTNSRYWLSVQTASYTTTAKIFEIQVIPAATYTTAEMVRKQCQFTNAFSSTSNPDIAQVHEMIVRAEGYIDYRTRKSWKLNTVTNELQDYNRYGTGPGLLHHTNIRAITALGIWDGSSFMALNVGRNQDYFVDFDRGIIYFTRLFLLPAAYGMAGRFFQWGFGEFKKSVQISYTWGRTFGNDAESYIIEDIATKMVAREIFLTHDYSSLVSSGMDNVSLSDKIRIWDEEKEEKLDMLQAISMY